MVNPIPPTLLFAASIASAITLKPIGTWSTGVFDEGAAEIVQYHPESQQLFIVNGNLPGIDVVQISDPKNPTKSFSIPLDAHGDGVQSVAIHDDLIAVAVSSDPATDNGLVAFFDPKGALLQKVEVGPLPDMVTFTPDGSYLLVANEGEPSDDYSIDPPGSVSIIPIGTDPLTAYEDPVHLTFESFDGTTIEGLHPGNPASSLSQNLEPEYIAVSPDGSIAMVTLQESNAIAIIDLEKKEISDLVGLGFQDHSKVPLDASDKDDSVIIRNWPTFGLFQPDSIVAFTVDGELYFATANEGDARDYDAWSEEARAKDLTLDSTVFPDAETLLQDDNLGRLKVSTNAGDIDDDGDYDIIFNYGGRSFSILDADGALVYDSGSVIEERLAIAEPDNFNSNNDENDSFDSRSDDKGPEPEAIAFAEVDGVPHLFVGLERVGGVAIFDVSDPKQPTWAGYFNNRDFSGNAEEGTAGDLGPESIIFIKGEESPTGEPILAVANEVSGTVTLFSIEKD